MSIKACQKWETSWLSEGEGKITNVIESVGIRILRLFSHCAGKYR
jgi:hypothetical protein